MKIILVHQFLLFYQMIHQFQVILDLMLVTLITNLTTGKFIRRFNVISEYYQTSNSILILSDKKRILTTNNYNQITVNDIATGDVIQQAYFQQVIFQLNQKTIFQHQANRILLWDTNNWSLTKEFNTIDICLSLVSLSRKCFHF